MFFDLSWSHILLFLVVALVVVGPKDLPKLMRKLGQWTAKARNMADQFRSSFDEMARQSELDELRKEIESLRNARPLAETEKAFDEALKIPDISLEPDAAAAPDAAPAIGAPDDDSLSGDALADEAARAADEPVAAEPGEMLPEGEAAPNDDEPELPFGESGKASVP